MKLLYGVHNGAQSKVNFQNALLASKFAQGFLQRLTFGLGNGILLRWESPHEKENKYWKY